MNINPKVWGRCAWDFFYFVANGLGGHFFSKTLKEHNQNVLKWRKIRDRF